MTDSEIPAPLRELIGVRDVGCTGVTLNAVTLLEELTDRPELLTQCVRFLRRELNGYASLWHLERALDGGDPRSELPAFGERLTRSVDASVATACTLLGGRVAGGFAVAPSSGITRRVLAALRTAPQNRAGRTGLCGADAVGPTEILNIVGTDDLARRLPTVIVTTPDRLVPADVFDSLGSPLFERIPLEQFEAVVVGGEVLTPAEAGARAAALSVRHSA